MNVSLQKVLAPPSSVAHALNWKASSGSILCFNIFRDRIDLAIASHPSCTLQRRPVEVLPSIYSYRSNSSSNSRVIISSQTVGDLASIVKDWDVCGFLVNWPVKKEGWCGAQCGRVLHTLGQIVDHQQQLLSSSSDGNGNGNGNVKNMSVLHANRPACLWDLEHHLPQEDRWGRTSVYSTTSNKNVYVASEEEEEGESQDQHGMLAAVDIWNDFCRTHWPEMYAAAAAQQERQQLERDDCANNNQVCSGF